MVDLEKGSKVQWLLRRSGVEVLDTSFLAYIGDRKSQTATEYLGISKKLACFSMLSVKSMQVRGTGTIRGHHNTPPYAT
jgi:hypothetical protein